jgi:hypothetical protein
MDFEAASESLDGGIHAAARLRPLRADAWRLSRRTGACSRSSRSRGSTSSSRSTRDKSVDSFVCECGGRGCPCALSLTLAEYESVRANAMHFAIARDHENPRERARDRRERAIRRDRDDQPRSHEARAPERPAVGAVNRSRRPPPDKRRGFMPPRAPAPGSAGDGFSPAKEGTTRDRKPGRAADLTSVDKRRRSSR